MHTVDRLSFTCPSDLAEMVKERAIEEHRSVSKWIVNAIEHYLLDRDADLVKLQAELEELKKAHKELEDLVRGIIKIKE